MIKRNIIETVLKYSKKYPVVTITGPRQSGKTTLCKTLFKNYTYFSLEDLDIRNFAKNDPRGFLSQSNDNGMIIDEIQNAPDLCSYIQTIVDANDKNGQFILTGSHNLQMLDSINQSLAGRTALAKLLPFSANEIYKSKYPDIEEILYKGFYPRIHDKKLNPTEALSFYLNTYVERDIRKLVNVKDLSKFEIFLKLCAGRTGSILNMSNLANDCGVTHNTIKNWLSVLKASYIIYLMKPHYKNFRKRLVKSPKLYFIDIGLASYLLDIKEPNHLKFHPLKGQLFETYIVSEFLKMIYNLGKTNDLYYFRDNVGNEIDILLENGNRITPIEIKSGQTINENMFKNLKYYQKVNTKNCSKPFLIYSGNRNQKRTNIEIVSYKNLFKVFEKKF